MARFGHVFKRHNHRVSNTTAQQHLRKRKGRIFDHYTTARDTALKQKSVHVDEYIAVDPLRKQWRETGTRVFKGK